MSSIVIPDSCSCADKKRLDPGSRWINRELRTPRSPPRRSGFLLVVMVICQAASGQLAGPNEEVGVYF